MRKLVNIAIAVGISMILYGPNAELRELLTIAAALFLTLQVVDMVKHRASKRQLAGFEAEARAERRRIQEMLGL